MIVEIHRSAWCFTMDELMNLIELMNFYKFLPLQSVFTQFDCMQKIILFCILFLHIFAFYTDISFCRISVVFLAMPCECVFFLQKETGRGRRHPIPPGWRGGRGGGPRAAAPPWGRRSTACAWRAGTAAFPSAPSAPRPSPPAVPRWWWRATW